MTPAQLTDISKQMARAEKATDDPVLKTLYGLVKTQARGPAKSTAKPELRRLMMRSLRDLESAISVRERRLHSGQSSTRCCGTRPKKCKRSR